MNYDLPYPSRREPVMGRAVVATSQPLAASAGLAMMAKGGNCVDAAIAAAMTLTVVEPSGNGVGSDAYALVHDGRALHGLNASGRSPKGWAADRFAGRDAMPQRGWEAVTVPGAVSAWIALWRRFGSLPLATVAAPAIGYARDGFAVTPVIATLWKRTETLLADQPGFADAFLPGGRAPRAGEIFRFPALAATLEAIAQTEGDAFYRGAVAERIVAEARRHGAALSADDLASHAAEWVEPLAQPFAGASVEEIPPNGQGIAALMAMGIAEAAGVGDRGVDDPQTLHVAIEAMKLAFADLYEHVADMPSMRVSPAELLDPAYLARRATLIDRARAGAPVFGAPKRGGTVYLCAADPAGRMISYIQSNYMGFGSGIVVDGVSLQNRGAGFVLTPGHVNAAGPGKRPLQTIIPAFATKPGGDPLMAFGVMGGPMQAQGHLQVALRILRYGQNPQAAADAPRWRVLAGRRVAVEQSMPAATVAALEALGHEIVVEPPDAVFAFGGAQIILRDGAGYVAGSEPRKDGQAVAF